MQGANGGDGELMGGQQTAEPPDTTETAEEDGSVGPRPRQSDGADGARSEHGVLARREYDLLTLEATGGSPANAGFSGNEDGHGALANREGTKTHPPPKQQVCREPTAATASHWAGSVRRIPRHDKNGRG